MPQGPHGLLGYTEGYPAPALASPQGRPPAESAPGRQALGTMGKSREEMRGAPRRQGLTPAYAWARARCSSGSALPTWRWRHGRRRQGRRRRAAASLARHDGEAYPSGTLLRPTTTKRTLRGSFTSPAKSVGRAKPVRSHANTKRTLRGSFTSPAKSAAGQSPSALTRTIVNGDGGVRGAPVTPPGAPWGAATTTWWRPG